MAIEIWKDDLLDREWDAEFLYNLAIGRNEENVRTKKGSFVLNIDAPWGQGKSFFLNSVFETVKQKGHPAVFINAWQYDFVDDPFAICVAALDRFFKSIEEQKEVTKTEKFQKGLKTLRSQFLNITLTLSKAVLKKAINKVAENGVDEVANLFEINDEKENNRSETKSAENEKGFADEMADAVTEELRLFSDTAIDKFAQKQIDSINETQNSLDLFQNGLALIIEAIGESKKYQLPLFIFIDELDRCRPTYAISMLERIKHIFDVPNVVFILATDTESLSHSVKAVYGHEFKSREYLGRFFNRTYILPQGSNEKIILSMLKDRGTDLTKWKFVGHNNDYEEAAIFLARTAAVFSMEVRPTKQAIEILMDITSSLNRKYPIELTYFFTLICCFIKTGKTSESEMMAIVNGNSANWRTTTRGQQVKHRDVLSRLLSHGKTPVDKALGDADVAYGNDGSVINSYLYDVISTEYTNAQENGNVKNLPSFTRYPEMILHARLLV